MIKIEHAVLATKFLGRGSDLAASQRNMKGYLYGHNGTALKRQLKVDYIFVVLIRLLNCHLKTQQFEYKLPGHFGIIYNKL